MTPSSSTLSTLERKASAGVQLAFRSQFQFDATLIRVLTNSPHLHQHLLDYFRWHTANAETSLLEAAAIDVRAILCSPPDFGLTFAPWPQTAGKFRAKEAFCDVLGGRVIRKVRTGMQFLVGPNTRLAVGDVGANSNQVINFILAQCMHRPLAQGAVLCHAAGVVRRDFGLALGAASGAGKSTLALHLLESDYDFVSNDRLLVSAVAGRTPQLRGIAKQPRVNPGTLLNNPRLTNLLSEERARTLRSLSRDELWHLEEKYDVDILAQYGPNRWRLVCPLRAVLLLNWTPGAESPVQFAQVRLRERDDLVELLAKEAGPFYLAPGDLGLPPPRARPAHESYQRMLSGAEVYEATGRVDFSEAVRFCNELTHRKG